ncbi:nucleosome assembly protein 1-like 4a isoform X1 [Hoplias malabaricus]|uniref:nucleosome assembly protein 1-like 4a isoform X1 n=1 Tax=Hoplias malabaricus TaxID=27720 RepID=UPI00346337FC
MEARKNEKNEARGKGGNKASQVDRPEIISQAESCCTVPNIQMLCRIPNIGALPKAVKRRVYALKRLQLQSAHTEAKFYEEVHELERKYAGLYQPIFEKRREVVSGAVEPTDEECEWHSEGEEEELAEDLKKKAALEEKKEGSAPADDPKGIPEFWLTIFKHVDMLGEMLQEHDEPILKHLQDITVKFSEPGQPMSFTLEFHFEPNSYFSNTVLTKVYKMKSEPDSTDPFSFEGPEIVDCEGCKIDWHKGKDVTVKIIKKKQKHKGRGTVRTITKEMPQDSFFNFFNPVKVSPDGMDEDLDFTLATDFEIGHFFRERIIPRAVLYFTGEALEDDESFEEEDLEEGEEEDLDEEGEEEDEGDNDPTTEPQPAECKQQ